MAYALGSAGFQITDRIVVGVVIYFYLPPEGRGLSAQIPEAVGPLGLTAFGAAMVASRVFDALADPLVGFASDRSRARMGRRRAFLAAGVGPMVGLPLLAFWPPGPAGSAANALWLAAVLSLYFVFFTIYVAPYLALLPEIARSLEERVSLSRLLALASFPALLAVSAWAVPFDALRSGGMAAPDAVRLVVVALSVAALALCIAPIVGVDERRHVGVRPASLDLRRALGVTIRNRAFLVYLAAQLLFILGVQMLVPMLPYYATVVLGRGESAVGWMMVGFGVGLALGFAVLGRATRRMGAKGAMVASVAVFAGGLLLLGTLRPDAPGGPRDAWNLATLWVATFVCGAPAAGFFALPNVLIGQLVDEDERRTGAQRSAMFFGIQGLVTKGMYGVSGALLSYLLLRFGKSSAEPWGVLLVGPVAAGACLLSALLYLRYPERRVLDGARGGEGE